jgi:hypothetical protein
VGAVLRDGGCAVCRHAHAPDRERGEHAALAAGDDRDVVVDAAGCLCIWAARDARRSGVSGERLITVTPAPQTITFTTTPPANPVAGDRYTVAATGKSGNAVTFSIDASSTAGTCSISGATVRFKAAGTCVIDANQAGTSNYLAADQTQQTVRVNPPTPSSICTLTKQDVQGSAKYQALPPIPKAGVDRLLTAACQQVDALAARLTPAQKAVHDRLRPRSAVLRRISHPPRRLREQASGRRRRRAAGRQAAGARWRRRVELVLVRLRACRRRSCPRPGRRS